ncbi:MAG: hypothetical protein ACRBEQ_07225 [Hyphomonas sp.]
MSIQFPFLTVHASELVSRSAWLVSHNGADPVTDPGRISGVSHTSRLTVSSNVSLICADILRSCQLSDDAELILSAFVSTGGGRAGRQRQTVWKRTLSADANGSFPVDFELSGGNVQERINLSLELVLGAPGSIVSPLAPSETGSRLWSDDFTINLSVSQLFPVQSVSFRENFPNGDALRACWRVEHYGDLDDDFFAAVLVYLNTDRKDFADRFAEEDPVLMSLVASDVIYTILERIILDDTSMETDDPYSVRGVAAHWAGEIFGASDARQLKEIHARGPQEMRMMIQGWAAL